MISLHIKNFGEYEKSPRSSTTINSRIWFMQILTMIHRGDKNRSALLAGNVKQL